MQLRMEEAVCKYLTWCLIRLLGLKTVFISMSSQSPWILLQRNLLLYSSMVAHLFLGVGRQRATEYVDK